MTISRVSPRSRTDTATTLIEDLTLIRLDLKREPHGLDLGHGVRVHVRLCTSALIMAARPEAQQASSRMAVPRASAAFCFAPCGFHGG